MPILRSYSFQLSFVEHASLVTYVFIATKELKCETLEQA